MLWITRYSTPQIPCALVSNRVHEMVLAHFNQARADIAAVKGVDEYPHDRTSAVWPYVHPATVSGQLQQSWKIASSEPAASFSVSDGTKSLTESGADETSVISYRWFAQFGGGKRPAVMINYKQAQACPSPIHGRAVLARGGPRAAESARRSEA